MKQVDIFIRGEAMAWYERNKRKIDLNNDPILAMIKKYKIAPCHSLEIGCSSGWRVDAMYHMGFDAFGVDPLIRDNNSGYLSFGTADYPNPLRNEFDLIIYGWCLYLCDPEDHFKIAERGNIYLNDGGYLIVYDFYPESPYKRPYKHKPGLFSHKMDFSQLWLKHPAYSLYAKEIYGDGDNRTAVTILKKDMKTAFPVRE